MVSRILLAPVTVSPTKPLTPTHLKYLLSLDVLHRATSLVADVDCLYHHGAFAGAPQVSGFWEYLERTGTPVDGLTETGIGELYVAYHQDGMAAPEQLEPVVRRAEQGWTHPVTERLLDLWERHYRLLGLPDHLLGRDGPELLGRDETIDRLAVHDLVVDGRGLAAPVYLDGTAAGMPLRPMVSADGLANYLMYTLQQLLPQLDRYDLVLLAHDHGIRHDYLLLEHALQAFGARTARFEVTRVPVEGSVRSARHGDWGGYTTADIAALLDESDDDAFRVGLRFYLVGDLGTGTPPSFSYKHLRRCIRRARALLDDPPSGVDTTPAGFLAGLGGEWVEPYRLTTALRAKDTTAPVGELLRAVYTAENPATTSARPDTVAPREGGPETVG